MGPAHVVRPNTSHPVAQALSGLLNASKTTQSADATDRNVRRSLAAYGAPLLGVQPRAAFSLPETILRGLKAARRDATVLRVLPVVVAKHAHDLDWADLKESARRMNLKSELGMLLELTGEVAGLPSVRAQADTLCDARRKRRRYFPMVDSHYERRLAEKRSPESAARWHFSMNMTEDSFREMLNKHV